MRCHRLSGRKRASGCAPGRERHAISAGLFNGTPFNYVMVGSNSDPTAVSSVVLRPRHRRRERLDRANAYQGNPGKCLRTAFRLSRSTRQLIVPQPNGQPGVGQAAECRRRRKQRCRGGERDESADDQAQAWTTWARRGRRKWPRTSSTTGSKTSPTRGENSRADSGDAPQATAALGPPFSSSADAPAVTSSCYLRVSKGSGVFVSGFRGFVSRVSL